MRGGKNGSASAPQLEIFKPDRASFATYGRVTVYCLTGKNSETELLRAFARRKQGRPRPKRGRRAGMGLRSRLLEMVGQRTVSASVGIEGGRERLGGRLLGDGRELWGRFAQVKARSGHDGSDGPGPQKSTGSATRVGRPRARPGEHAVEVEARADVALTIRRNRSPSRCTQPLRGRCALLAVSLPRLRAHRA